MRSCSSSACSARAPSLTRAAARSAVMEPAATAIYDQIVASARARSDQRFYQDVAKVRAGRCRQELSYVCESVINVLQALVVSGFELLSDLDGASRVDMVLPEGVGLSSAQWAFILQLSAQTARNNSMPATHKMCPRQ